MAGKTKGWPPALLTPVKPADIKRGDGEHVVEFIEAMCPQVKDSVGGRAGEPLILRPWQRKLMGALFARRPDKRYKHKTALVGLARKNGKSALIAGGAESWGSEADFESAMEGATTEQAAPRAAVLAAVVSKK